MLSVVFDFFRFDTLKSYCRVCVDAFSEPCTITFVKTFETFFSDFELYKIRCTPNDSWFAYKKQFMTRILLYI